MASTFQSNCITSSLEYEEQVYRTFWADRYQCVSDLGLQMALDTLHNVGIVVKFALHAQHGHFSLILQLGYGLRNCAVAFPIKLPK